MGSLRISLVACQDGTLNPQKMLQQISGFVAFVLNMIIMGFGIKYCDTCPAQPMLPVYLIVMGVFGVSAILLSCLAPKQEDGSPVGICSYFMGFLGFFLLVWLICGSAIVFGMDSISHEDPSLPNYCPSSAYNFAYGIIVFEWVMIVCSCSIGCCIGCFKFFSSGWEMLYTWYTLLVYKGPLQYL